MQVGALYKEHEQLVICLPRRIHDAADNLSHAHGTMRL